jgi:hypothetical protein
MELATRITEEKFGEGMHIELEDEDGVLRFTEEAQDFYNEVYDEYETLTNNMLGVYSNNELNK